MNKTHENLRLIDLSIFDYKLKIAFMRYGVITILALLNAHIRIGMMPFHPEYIFPMRSFAFGLFFGLSICTTSWIVSNYFKERIFTRSKINFKSIIEFLVLNAIVAVLVYTALVIIIFGFPVPITFYSVFLFVTLSVIIIENLFFLLYGTLISNSNLGKELQKIDRKSVMVPVGAKTINVEIDDISFVELKNGIVLFNLKNKRTINSQFDSLEQLEKELPRKFFYRANRQFIVHRDSILNIQKDINRKIKLLVSNESQDREIMVSRYKSKELKSWLEGVLERL